MLSTSTRWCIIWCLITLVQWSFSETISFKWFNMICRQLIETSCHVKTWSLLLIEWVVWWILVDLASSLFNNHSTYDRIQVFKSYASASKIFIIRFATSSITSIKQKISRCIMSIRKSSEKSIACSKKKSEFSRCSYKLTTTWLLQCKTCSRN